MGFKNDRVWQIWELFHAERGVRKAKFGRDGEAEAFHNNILFFYLTDKIVHFGCLFSDPS